MTQDLTLPIYEMTRFTMLDYPDKTACVIWFSGCNMRCQYCHNPELIKPQSCLTVDDVMAFLKSRKNLLQAVVLSGGEATLYPDLVPFARKIKEMGFLVKLDTNGTKPDRVRQMVQEGLIDYIALDLKATPERARVVTGVDYTKETLETLAFLAAEARVPYEIRTTVHSHLHTPNDVNQLMKMAADHGHRGIYYVQNFQPVQKQIPANDSRAHRVTHQNGHLDVSKLNPPTDIHLRLRNFG